jgi:hypothetical protein
MSEAIRIRHAVDPSAAVGSPLTGEAQGSRPFEEISPEAGRIAERSEALADPFGCAARRERRRASIGIGGC